MGVDVHDRLARPSAGVEDQAPTGLDQALDVGHGAGAI
jgi:hypothetical protein